MSFFGQYIENGHLFAILTIFVKKFEMSAICNVDFESVTYVTISDILPNFYTF